MGVGSQQLAVRRYRGQIPSPGRPTVAWRQDRVRFWAAIARGASSEQAAAEIGVSQAVGTRWFRHAGGVRPQVSASPSGRYLSFAECEEIALWRPKTQVSGRSPDGWAGRRRRSPGRCGATPRRGRIAWSIGHRRRSGTPSEGRQDRLAGVLRMADGTIVSGPAVPRWTGRNKPGRQDRRWATAWSPQQIANRLPIEFLDDASMRISHKAIYQALYVQDRAVLQRELVACLRTGRALRIPRARARRRPTGHVTPETTINQRPGEVEGRAVPGHWEGDLIIGTNSSAIGTLVERTTRFTVLLHLPRMAGYGSQPYVHNGPALAGRGATAVRDPIAAKLAALPEHLRRTLTWDRGKELAQHDQLTNDTDIAVYFADPHSPWRRGTNENTNGLLRQFFPKGTDLSRWTTREIDAATRTLNDRPRKTLGWKTPTEALNEHLQSAKDNGVATTG